MRPRSSPVVWALLALVLARCPAPAAEFEVGANYVDVQDNVQGEVQRKGEDWVGEVFRARFGMGGKAKGQVDLLHQRRGRDSGQLASFSSWVDWNEHLFTFQALTVSQGATFLPEYRVDFEAHFKLPPKSGLVLFGGGGVAEFEDARVDIFTGGVTRYFHRGVFSYRYYSFDNEARTANALDGNGKSHLLDLLLDAGASDSFDLKFLRGEDFLRDFSLTGADARFRSDTAYLGWSHKWTDRFGTYVELQWSRKEDIYEQRGIEFRITLRD